MTSLYIHVLRKVACYLLQAFVITFVALLLGLFRAEYTISPPAMNSDSGFAVIAKLPGSNAYYYRPADDSWTGLFAPPVVVENGNPLAPGASLHEDIRSAGKGRHALNGNYARFSSSDGSSPLSNNRDYQVCFTLLPGWLTLVAGITAIGTLLIRLRHCLPFPAHTLAWPRAIWQSTWFLAFVALLTWCIDATTSWDLVVNGTGVLILCIWPVWVLALSQLLPRLKKLSLTCVHKFSMPQYVAPLVTALAMMAWSVALGVSASPENYFSMDTFGPTLWHYGSFIAEDGSIQAEVYGKLPTITPVLLALAAKTLHMSPASLYVAVTWICLLVAYVAVVIGAAKLGGSPWAAALAAILGPSSFIFNFHIGYPPVLGFPWSNIGTWASYLTIGIWVAWLLSPRRGWRSYIPYFSSGLLFTFHSTYGTALILAMAISEGLTILRGPSRSKLLIRSTTRGGAVLAAAAPQLYWLLRNNFDLVAQPVDQAWWKLMSLQKWYHVYLWDSQGIQYSLLMLSILFFVSLCAWMLVSERDSKWSIFRRLIASWLAASLLSFASFLAFSVIPTPRVAGLVLSRAFMLPVFSVIVLVSALPFLAAGKFTSRPSLSAAISVLSFCAAALLVAQTDATVSMSWLLICLIAGGGLALVVDTKLREDRLQWSRGGCLVDSRSLPLVIVAISFASLASAGAWNFVGKIQSARQEVFIAKDTDWSATMEFLRTKTGAASLLIVPPIPYSLADAQRSFVIDYAHLGFSVYTLEALPFERRALRDMFGIDIAEMSENLVADLRSKPGGFLCLLERGYSELLSDSTRLKRLAKVYPLVDYAIGFQPGARPHGWTCATHSAPILDLPIAYLNDTYVVYDMRSETR
jgi:hypothetical protein